ncbi:flagellar assembly protein FliH [Buchnera aphidicola]|uniref:Flagellar assembly protein FliH n=1 Tax=Buchnera aphidicola (Artemisaphis artemisicola) TaxID=1241836 RepID=A0A4D6XIT9_9GAMM|nr:flagellar assembly protein FliH [Buchnera aphidicola]QCI15769.1 flagellar assembly protein FliH [Buchnera aphidicola (Artemisaphis artemisicola)]
MINSILEKNWIHWYPKKIFLNKDKNNIKTIYYSHKLKQEDFFTNTDILNRKNEENINKTTKNLEKDLKKTESYKLGFEKGCLSNKEKNLFLEKKINSFLLDFENSFSAFENALSSRLFNIILKVSSYVIGKKIDIDKSMLLNYIKKVIDQDGVFLTKPQLIVHPDNKNLIEKMLKKFLNSYKWTLLYDNNVDLNSFKVKSENVDIDSTVNARWQELYRLICLKEEY